MALPAYCASCRSIAPSTNHEPRLSIGSGFRFGLGFMSAAVVFWILFSVIFFGALGAIFGSVFRSLPR